MWVQGLERDVVCILLFPLCRAPALQLGEVLSFAEVMVGLQVVLVGVWPFLGAREVVILLQGDVLWIRKTWR